MCLRLGEMLGIAAGEAATCIVVVGGGASIVPTDSVLLFAY